ncbi:MAG: methyltransferase domain-containing protein, partial [Patescibacteria group bacterium]
KIDFEKDTLPYADNSIDNILAFNLFEHIFHHQFLIKEIFRVLRPGGQLIGSVPFLVKIHPDPNDYFRYSAQALEALFQKTGFQEIRVDYVGKGPFTSQYSQIEFILPRICRVICAHFHLFLDKVFLLLKPGFNTRFPLSYIFIAMK